MADKKGFTVEYQHMQTFLNIFVLRNFGIFGTLIDTIQTLNVADRTLIKHYSTLIAVCKQMEMQQPTRLKPTIQIQKSIYEASWDLQNVKKNKIIKQNVESF